MRWKQYGDSITVPNGPLAKLVMKKVLEGVECLKHSMFYDVISNGYRVYRRGKNR